jgi:hypothetical protein
LNDRVASWDEDQFKKFRDLIGFTSPAKKRKLDEIIAKSEVAPSKGALAKRKAKPRNCSVYAAVYVIKELEKLKAELMVIKDDRGQLVDWFAGPATISDYYGRFNAKTVKVLVKQTVEDSFGIKVRIKDIHLLPVRKVDRVLYELENK